MNYHKGFIGPIIAVVVVLLIGGGLYLYKQSNLPIPTEQADQNTKDLITVTYPNGGETFKAGDSITVIWQNSSQASFVALLGDPEQGYCLPPNFEQPLAGDVVGSTFTIDGSTTRKLTEGNTCRFKIKITSNINPALSDQSDDYFVIK